MQFSKTMSSVEEEKRNNAMLKASGISKKTESVMVAVRCRPMNGKERQQGFKQAVHIDQKTGSLTLAIEGDKEPPKQFTFDSVYGDNCTQREIYDRTAAPIVDCVMEGYNG